LTYPIASVLAMFVFTSVEEICRDTKVGLIPASYLTWLKTVQPVGHRPPLTP
jgi:hypothetical protein